MFTRRLFLAAVAALGLSGANASAATVSLELMLLTDTSGSVSSTDFSLMMEGYASAFEDATVQDKILNSSTGSIAVAVSQFDSSYRGLSTAWTLIDSIASANSFAMTLRSVVRAGLGGTSLISGLAGAGAEFTNNGYDSNRQVIDLAGDGYDGSCGATENCAALQQQRDATLAGETDTINAIFVNDRNFFGDTGSEQVNSIAYGENNVIGGDGAFVTSAANFIDFKKSIRRKLIREITPPPPPVIPVPASLPLLATAFIGLGFLRRRKRS